MDKQNTLNASSVLDFLLICGKLKTEKRTGWVNNKVHLPESISDHMHRMAMASFLIQDSSINRDKCIKISLVHDLAESLVGDITPSSGISKEEKNKLEENAMQKIKDTLSPSTIGEEIYQLWLEYETKSSPEARLVKDLDKFEMILQAFEYEESQNLTLQTFYDSTEGQFFHPEVKKWVEQLYERRKILKKQ